jgi:hypothetical protein
MARIDAHRGAKIPRTFGIFDRDFDRVFEKGFD